MLRALLAIVGVLLLEPLPVSAADTAKDRANPLLSPWPGPHGGVPPFDRIQVEDFVPAMAAAMALQRREIAAITANPAPPTFANTVEPFERSFRPYWHVSRMYYLWRDSLNSPAMRQVERQIEPRLAAFFDEVNLDARLFARIDAVHRSEEYKRLTPEQQRLVWLYRTQMLKQGAGLNAADKARVAALNQRMSELQTAFRQNVRADDDVPALVIDDAADLVGLDKADIAGAEREAARRALQGRWVITNSRPAVEPFLINSPRRALREKAWRAFFQRGEGQGTRDNYAIAAQLLTLRNERAQLMGFADYPTWKLSDAMLQRPQATIELMMQIWQPALAQGRAQLAAMQSLLEQDFAAQASGSNATIEPWDLLYYRERLRKARFDFDEAEIAPYLRFDKLREAMFWTAERLYGLQFRPASGVPSFHPDVTVYEVLGPGKRHVGLLYLDPFIRPGKNSGAWMTSFRIQGRMGENVTPIVSLNLNYRQGKPGEPVRVSWTDAVVLFHEFGHVLYGLTAKVVYPRLLFLVSDWNEVPSEAHENWLLTRPVLNRLVDDNGRPPPPALIDKLERADRFEKPLHRLWALSSGLLDMQMHLNATAAAADMKGFEQKTLAALGTPEAIVPRHRTPHFLHIFGSEGYAAGYYRYIWADMLGRDIFDAFVEAGDPFDAKTSRRYLDLLLAVGNTVDPTEAFRRFRGRDPKADHLLRAEGLVD